MRRAGRDRQGVMRLIQKPDRRRPNRLVTPPCARCLSPDDMYVADRAADAVHWRCATCGESWGQAKPLPCQPRSVTPAPGATSFTECRPGSAPLDVRNVAL